MVSIADWFQHVQGKYVDVEIAGRVFGGRRGESPQLPVSFQYDEDILVIRFGGSQIVNILHPTHLDQHVEGGTELLTIVRPRGLATQPPIEVSVADADAVTFGWHYYGRRQESENWCMETYRFSGDVVICTGSGPLYQADHQVTFARPGASAVRLLTSSWL